MPPRGVQTRQKRGRKRRRKHRNPIYDPHYFTDAGPVVVKTMDGEVKEILPAYNEAEFQRLVKVRANISLGTQQRVFRRDKQTCRYCGDVVGPFHIDHVVPIVMGGSNRMHNLVTACSSCNLRKGGDVWKPRPVRRKAS